MSRPTLLTGLALMISLVALVVGLVKLALVEPTATPAGDEGADLVGRWMPGAGREGIGVVDISGVIQFGTEDMGPFSSFQSTAEGAAQRIRRLRRDDKVKAIVLRINSPGGSLAASQEIFEEVRLTAREANKPVVVSMGDVAASGAYYVSAPATRILAYPGTATGSIGVIMNGLNFKGLMERYGVSMQSFASGKNKDTLAYWRDPRPDEIELLNAMVREAYEQFLTAVVEQRGIPREELEPYADGRILLGTQAKELKLVDELGGFRDAVRVAAELAGLDPEDPHLIRGKPDFFERFDFSLGGLAGALLQTRTGWVQAPLPGGRLAETSWPISYLYRPPSSRLPLAEVAP